jgi:CRP/FNR family transcriptional regulator, cyclic AMP receptor protein
MVSESRSMSALDADSELGHLLSGRDRNCARAAATAAVLEVPAGEWSVASLQTGSSGFGLLILEGLITRTTSLLGRSSIELLGREDLIRPWEELSDTVPLSLDVRWSVHQDARLAVLDEDFARSVSSWPMIASALVARSARRARGLAFQTAMLEHPRLDVRLMLLFWHLADRWGRVGPDGVAVRIDVTHKMLGRLVRAQRPSVTASLCELARRGVLTRREDGAWMLHGSADEQLKLLSGRASGADPRRASADSSAAPGGALHR